MITFLSQEARSQPTQDFNPFRFTLSEFKFTPKSSSPVNFKIKYRPNTHASRDSISTPQIARSNSSKCEGDKKHERFTNGSNVLLPEEKDTDDRHKMFMTWKERSSSSKKMYVPIDRVIQDFKKTGLTLLPKRVKSEKKLTSLNFDVDLRRNKVQTANRVVQRSPMELLTRKLEWQGKQKRKLVPFVSESQTQKMFDPPKDHHQKLVFQSISGWEGHRHEDEFIFSGDRIC